MTKSTSKKIRSAGKTFIYWLLIGIIVLLCFFTFLNYWYNSATDVRITRYRDTQIKDGITTYNFNLTMIITNYFPFQSHEFEPLIFNQTNYYVDAHRLRAISTQISNNVSQLSDWNTQIFYFYHNAKYGEEQLRGYPHIKEENFEAFPTINTFGMTNNTVYLKWNCSVLELAEYDGISYLSVGYSWVKINPLLPNFISYVFYHLNPIDFLWPYLIFAFCGFVFSYHIFKNIGIEKSYGQLILFDSKVKGKGIVEIDKNVTKSIKSIINFPKEIHSLKRLFFGLSIFMFKLIANSSCKKHNEKIDGYSNIYPYQRKGLKKIFSKIKDQSFDEVKDFFPEFKTITIVIGFLAAVGISFSWDVGAAAPFLYSVFLFYFFMNLGSAIHFLQKTWDIIWPIAIFDIAVFVINFPAIIVRLRVIPVRPITIEEIAIIAVILVVHVIVIVAFWALRKRK